MGIREAEFKFELSRPLAYKFDGQGQEAGYLILREPGMEHRKHTTRLRNMLNRAQMELAQRAGQVREAAGEIVRPLNESVEKIESEYEQAFELYKACIDFSETVDSWQFFKCFETMVTERSARPICMIDGRQAMNEVLWKNLSPDDADELTLRYCAFFATPSREGSKTTSEQRSESHTEPMAV